MVPLLLVALSLPQTQVETAFHLLTHKKYAVREAATNCLRDAEVPVCERLIELYGQTKCPETRKRIWIICKARLDDTPTMTEDLCDLLAGRQGHVARENVPAGERFMTVIVPKPPWSK